MTNPKGTAYKRPWRPKMQPADLPDEDELDLPAHVQQDLKFRAAMVKAGYRFQPAGEGRG